MSEITHQYVMQPALVGATGGVMSIYLVPSDEKVLGLPAPVTLGLALAASSVVNGVLDEFVYETVLSENESEVVESLVSPVITGLASATMGWLMVGVHMNPKLFVQFFGLGVSAEIMGGYAHSAVLGPAMNV